METKTLLSPYALAALLAVLAFSSCSKVNDMHDATMQMAATTQHMAASTDKLGANTADLKAGTDQLKQLMAEILDEGRQGDALRTRNENWDEMLQEKQPDAKAVHACAFFQAFEFELWTQVGLDAEKDERYRLTAYAVEEFFGRVAGITHWGPDEVDAFAGVMPAVLSNPLSVFSKPFVPSDLDNEKESFNALSVTLEKANREEEFAPSSPTDELSMIGLIETALTAGQKIKSGKAKLGDYPAYVNLVLQNEELATRLLRARVQTTATAPLCKITSLCQDLKEGAKYLLEKQAWDMDFAKLNESEVKYVAFYLGESIKARDFLSSQGIETKLDGRILQVYAQRRVINAPTADAATDGKARAALQVLDELRDLTGK